MNYMDQVVGIAPPSRLSPSSTLSRAAAPASSLPHGMTNYEGYGSHNVNAFNAPSTKKQELYRPEKGKTVGIEVNEGAWDSPEVKKLIFDEIAKQRPGIPIEGQWEYYERMKQKYKNRGLEKRNIAIAVAALMTGGAAASGAFTGGGAAAAGGAEAGSTLSSTALPEIAATGTTGTTGSALASTALPELAVTGTGAGAATTAGGLASGSNLAKSGLTNTLVKTGAGLASSYLASEAAKEQSRESAEATDAAIQNERDMFNTVRDDTAYAREVSNDSLSKLSDKLDLNRDSDLYDVNMNPEFYERNYTNLDPADYAFNPNDVVLDPGYEFRRGEGERGLENMLSSQGRSMGGAALREAMRYNQDFASNEYDKAYRRSLGENVMDYDRGMTANTTDYTRGLDDLSLKTDEYNRAYGRQQTNLARLMSLAGLGSTAANTSANAGTSSASNVAQLLSRNAAMQSDASNMKYASINNALQGIFENYQTNKYLNQ